MSNIPTPIPTEEDEGSGAADMAASMWAEWINDHQPVDTDGETPATLSFEDMSAAEQALVIASCILHEND